MNIFALRFPPSLRTEPKSHSLLDMSPPPPLSYPIHRLGYPATVTMDITFRIILVIN